MLKAVEGYRADVHVVYNMAEAFERKDLGWRRGWDSNSPTRLTASGDPVD
jgi:hypothetical protein